MDNIKISSLSRENSTIAKLSWVYSIFAGVTLILLDFVIVYVYDKYVEPINDYFLYNLLVIIVGIISYIIAIIFVRVTDNSIFFLMPDLIPTYIIQIAFVTSVVALFYELDPPLIFFLSNTVVHFTAVSLLSSAYFTRNHLYLTTLQPNDSKIILKHTIDYPIIGYHIKHEFIREFSKDEKLKLVILKSVSRRFSISTFVTLKYEFISHADLTTINQNMKREDLYSHFLVYFLLDGKSNLPPEVEGLLVKGRISLSEVNELIGLFNNIIETEIVQFGNSITFNFDLISFKIKINKIHIS